jgi:NADH:ubiquinone oxidoreductase subunit 4 (subunit M)
MEEINAREIFCLAPLGIIVLAVGIWPMPLLDLLNASAVRLVDLVKAVL